MQKKETYGRLKPDAVRDIASGEGFPTVRRLFRWMRQQSPPLRGSEHDYVRLKKRGAVPWSLLEALVGYMAAKRNRRFGVDSIAERAEPPDQPSKKPGLDPWEWSWARIYEKLTAPLQLPEETFCRDEKDLDLAASLGMQCVGRHHAAHGAKLTDGDAERLGEKMMGRSRNEYGRWLRGLWEVDNRAVLFLVMRIGKGDAIVNERLGVMASVPLRRAVYQRFRNGEIEDSEFTVEDFESPSNYVNVHMAAQSEVDGLRRKARLSLWQLHIFLYQLAMIVPDQVRGSVAPCFVALGGTAENETRMKTHGFEAVGTATPRTSKQLWELKPAEARRKKTKALSLISQYDLVWVMLRRYQALFAEERRVLNLE